MRRPAAVAGLAAVAVLALAVWGLGGRDLAGDELNMLHGNPVQIAQWSLDPRGGFVGHLPWSFWLRWASLSVFGEDPAWAWRLHAVLGGMVAAGVTGWAAGRSLGAGAGALAAALLVANPVLAFHTQDASNYAWSAAVGAGMLAGLLELQAGRRLGAGILAGSLFIGALNDFYSVLIAGPALVASIWLARPSPLRRPVLVAWLTPLAIVLPVVVLFAVRLMDSTGEAVVDVHADPIPPRPLPALLDAPWRVARRVLGAHLHGYAGGRDDNPWFGGPPVLLALSAAGLVLRSRAWPAAVLVAGGLVLHGLLGVGLQLGAERVLPYEPRSLIGLAPALAIVLAALTQASRPRLGLLLAGTWLLGSGVSTLQARLQPADLRERALGALLDELRPDDTLVIPDERTRRRLPSRLQEQVSPCVPANSSSAVWLATHAADLPPSCPEGESRLLVQSRRIFDAPVHEGSAASFLPRRIVARLGEASAPTLQRHLTRATSGPFEGLGAVRWELADGRGELLQRAEDLRELRLPSGGELLYVSAFPATRSRLPDHPLLSALHNRIESWEIDPLDPRPTVQGAPFGSPAMTTLRRLLPVLGLLLALGLALPRRTP